MKERKYIIEKDGRVIDTISRAGEVTILSAALGIAYSESEQDFLYYIDTLKKNGYKITES